MVTYIQVVWARLFPLPSRGYICAVEAGATVKGQGDSLLKNISGLDPGRRKQWLAVQWGKSRQATEMNLCPPGCAHYGRDTEDSRPCR